ncbi:recombination regulator RecX [Tessaracoccus sp. OS52]|uniref:regulatory protein RecX n=1 Tax=Tessaracoccus sp. OS52 TaxID=2886691 RepID=UPI001D123130|nr:regulatory protein RecX [Tessaracoccus sp. OS52]MCC2593131.1 recombination regulator RecX [Tessaracoccus sp. OS52]
MSRDQQVEFAYRIALRLLETRARTEHELRAAMRKKDVPSDVADEIMQRLKELRYVDDDAFAEALTVSRVNVSHRGRTRIRQELQAKGIQREAVDEVLAELDPSDEWAAARAFATRRAGSLAGLERHVAMRRLRGALARRGFGMDIVVGVSEEALGRFDD